MLNDGNCQFCCNHPTQCWQLSILSQPSNSVPSQPVIAIVRFVATKWTNAIMMLEHCVYEWSLSFYLHWLLEVRWVLEFFAYILKWIFLSNGHYMRFRKCWYTMCWQSIFVNLQTFPWTFLFSYNLINIILTSVIFIFQGQLGPSSYIALTV